jgi:tRNA-dihydrouridine synthase B
VSTGALDSPERLAAASRAGGVPASDAPRVGPLAPIRLGPLVVDPPLFLAPMAGFTNLAFRRVVRRLGCPLAATEMVMAEGVVRGHERTLELAALAPDERPGVVQIAGSDPAVMGEAAARLVDRGADAIDVNMGCPVRKIVDRCAGSALLREPAKAAGIVEGIRRRVAVPVTVKIRAGWDDESQSVDVARAL